MATQIYSKKTNAELIALTAEVASNKGQYDARVTAVDASLGEILAEIAGNKAEYDARVTAVDASLSSIVAEAEANRLQAVSDLSDLEAFLENKIDTNKAAHDASLSAVDTRLDAKIDAEKVALQANIDALAASSSGASTAVAGRVDALEAKVGADLTATINSALTDEVVKTTLDSFLAKDEELTAAVNGAVAERVNMDNEIKAKFDLLVSKLFEGLEFSGVTQAELSFGAPVAGGASGGSSYTINFPDGSQQVVTSADEVDFTGWTFGSGHPETVRRAIIYGDVLYLLGAWNNRTSELTTYWVKIKMATGEISTVSLGHSVNYADFDPANELTERTQISGRIFSKGGVEYPGSVDDF